MLLPPIAWKIPAKGPLEPFAKNPNVGEPPLIQAFSGAVEKPKPSNLSKKAQRNSTAIKNLSMANVIFRGFSCIFISSYYLINLLSTENHNYYALNYSINSLQEDIDFYEADA
jgi:hypothetical protein